MLEDMHHFMEELERSYSRKLLYTPPADFENITNVIRNSITSNTMDTYSSCGSGDSLYHDKDEFIWNSSIKLAINFFSFPVRVRIVEGQIGRGGSRRIPLLDIYTSTAFPLFLLKGISKDVIRESIDFFLIKGTPPSFGEYWAYLGRVFDGIVGFYWEKRSFSCLFGVSKSVDYRALALEIVIKSSEFAIYSFFDNPIMQHILPPLLLTPLETIQRRIMWGNGDLFGFRDDFRSEHYVYTDRIVNTEHIVANTTCNTDSNGNSNRDRKRKYCITDTIKSLYHGLPIKLSLSLLNLSLEAGLNFGKSLDEEGYFRNDNNNTTTSNSNTT